MISTFFQTEWTAGEQLKLKDNFTPTVLYFYTKEEGDGGFCECFYFIFILFSVQFSAEIWLCELLSEKFAIPESASVLPVEMGDEEE